MPFTFSIPGREELPDAGWGSVVRWAHEDRALARAADALSALEITLLPSHRSRGASRVVLNAMRQWVAEVGHRHMFAPVRPTEKALEPKRFLLDHGDDRSLPTVQRHVGRMANGEARISAEMRVILRLLRP